LRGLAADLGAVSEITLFGETLGVQDLMYGLSGGAIALRAFDLRVDGNYVDGVNFYLIMDRVGVPTVPVLYEGPFDVAKIWEVASGKTQAMTADGKSHLREGVVVRPLIGRMDMTLGRVILKFVSDAYLTRGGNATELE
jgi:RNA ligase (TIGR02306 family)